MVTLWEGNGIARGWQFSFQSPRFLKHKQNEWVSLGETFELPILAGPGLVFHFSDSNLITEVGTAGCWLNRTLPSVGQRAKPYMHEGQKRPSFSLTFVKITEQDLDQKTGDCRMSHWTILPRTDPYCLESAQSRDQRGTR